MRTALAAFIGASIASTLAAQCPPHWDSPLGIPGVAGPGGPVNIEDVLASCYFDPDGPGPRPGLIVIAGNFTSAGGRAVSGLAAWDGSSWAPLGQPLNGTLRCLSVYDADGPDGPAPAELLVGGTAILPGSGLARYNAAAGIFDTGAFGNVSGEVYTMTTLRDTIDQPPALCISGSNTRVNNSTLGGAALRWDGAAWSSPFPVSAGFYIGPIRSIAAFDHDGPGPAVDRLYATGLISTSGVVVFSEGDWRSITSPPPAPIGTFNALTVWDADGAAGPVEPMLIAAGQVNSGVWKWSPAAGWSTFGQGLNSSVYSVAALPDPATGAQTLVAGGLFTFSGGTPIQSVAQWTGSAWAPLGLGILGGSGPQRNVETLTPFNDPRYGGSALFIGGRFGIAGGFVTNSAAVWNRSEWLALGGPPLYPTAAIVHDADNGAGPTLYVSGSPFAPGTPPTFPTPTTNRFVKRTQGGWSPIPIQGSLLAMAEFEQPGSTSPGGHKDLYIGGFLGTIEGVVASGIARYNGSTWLPLGDGINAPITGGWTPYVAAIEAWRPSPGAPLSIVAGGQFLTAGPVTSPGVAAFDGTQWRALGAGLSSSVPTQPVQVNALLLFDFDGPGPQPPRLVAGGFFNNSGGTPMQNIAVYDSEANGGAGQWLPMGQGLGGPQTGTFVSALAAFDEDGPGPAIPVLYASGSFLTSGQTTLGGAARWNPSLQVWQPLSGVLAPTAGGGGITMAVFDDDGPVGPNLPALYIGGSIQSAGGITVPRLARWTGAAWSPLPIPAAAPSLINRLLAEPRGIPGHPGAGLYAFGSGGLSGWSTTQPFLARWGGCPRCAGDFDQDNTVTPADVAAFVQVFASTIGTPGPAADFDLNGIVNAADVAAFVQAWLESLQSGC